MSIITEVEYTGVSVSIQICFNPFFELHDFIQEQKQTNNPCKNTASLAKQQQTATTETQHWKNTQKSKSILNLFQSLNTKRTTSNTKIKNQNPKTQNRNPKSKIEKETSRRD